tara:strand:- start:453 stop:965 length:513 start_codon:yes stop_codon:yes gene_type:complete
MDIKPLTYNGRDEGVAVTLSTILKPGDDASKISEAVLNLFPEAALDPLGEETFPSKRNISIECLNLSLETFLTLIRQQSILDTAMDAMAKRLDGNSTSFSISRLAALANKIAFTYEEVPLGGCFTIHLEGTGLGDWIEAVTWHNGRQEIPRQLNDDLAMLKDGEAATWHQ